MGSEYSLPQLNRRSSPFSLLVTLKNKSFFLKNNAFIFVHKIGKRKSKVVGTTKILWRNIILVHATADGRVLKIIIYHDSLWTCIRKSVSVPVAIEMTYSLFVLYVYFRVSKTIPLLKIINVIFSGRFYTYYYVTWSYGSR